jgi:hypothetical protein
MSARALAFAPRRGLSDRDCGYFVPATRVGELSRISIAAAVSPRGELIEADAALTCSAWFLPTANAMFSLTSFPAGWDSGSARRIERATVEHALRLLAGILESRITAPTVVPTPSGGVQTEWHMGGLDIEIEFRPGSEAYVSVEDLRDRTEWEGELYPNVDRLRTYLPRLGGV